MDHFGNKEGKKSINILPSFKLRFTARWAIIIVCSLSKMQDSVLKTIKHSFFCLGACCQHNLSAAITQSVSVLSVMNKCVNNNNVHNVIVRTVISI